MAGDILVHDTAQVYIIQLGLIRRFLSLFISAIRDRTRNALASYRLDDGALRMLLTVSLHMQWLNIDLFLLRTNPTRLAELP